MKKILRAAVVFTALALLGTGFISCSDGDDSSSDNSGSQNPATPEKPGDSTPSEYDDSALSAATLWVVGDSTVCDYVKDGKHTDATYFYPRYGYGTQLANNLSSKITVRNLALSGRSAKSFLTEENYQTLIAEIKEGDFLVIGFGHNDQKSDDSDRFASAAESTDTDGSFKNILFNKYVKVAQEKNATPIICSPIVRLSSSNDYSGSYAHITASGDYRKAAEELANEKSVQFVDLTTMTKEKYTELGYDEAIYFHAMAQGSSADLPNLKSVDGTHINIYGAKMVSYFFAKTISQSSCALKPYVKSTYLPSKDKDLVKNPDYVFVDYTAPDLSKLNSVENLKCTSEGWYGTAFGDCGGDPSAASNGFFAQETSAGIFKVGQTGTASPKGKITDSADGFAFAFKQIPVSKNFTLTAKAKVLVSVAGKNQAGFGLMLRDDCYAPNKIAVSSNYVSAGLYADSVSTCIANWKRESGSLKVSENKISALYNNDETAEFTIERVGQVVKVKTVYKGNVYETTYTDFDFVAKDSNYFYAGMFGTRGTCVEFTDVVLTITGESQGA